MLGKLTSVEHGPERNVKVTVTTNEVFSEIADPPGRLRTSDIVEYVVRESLCESEPLVSLEFVMTKAGKVTFYRTQSRFDMALLLDWLDSEIGVRPRRWIEK